MVSKRSRRSLPPPLDEAALRKIEKRLGFAIPNELRELYSTKGNGGFGPAGGVLGLGKGGFGDDSGRDALELYERWFLKPKEPLWPEGVLPIAYEGCNIYLCVDVKSPRHPILRHDGGAIDFSEGAVSKRAFAKAFAKTKATLATWLGDARASSGTTLP